jgi:hypothetical protein
MENKLVCEGKLCRGKQSWEISFFINDKQKVCKLCAQCRKYESEHQLQKSKEIKNKANHKYKDTENGKLKQKEAQENFKQEHIGYKKEQNAKYYNLYKDKINEKRNNKKEEKNN